MSRRRTAPRRRHGQPRSVMLVIGFVTAGIASLMMFVGFNAPNSIPGRDYYVVSVEFDDADNITGHHSVRMGGRHVGQVLRPRVEKGRAVVDLQLEGAVRPLRSDTTVRIRPRSPVGVRFVELTPGRRGTPLAEGDVIPADQTSSTVTLDTALGTLDARRRRAARTVVSTLGGGFTGRGEELNDTISRAPGMLRDLDVGLTPLNRMPGATQGFVAGSAAAAGAAGPVRDDIAGGLEPEAAVLGTVARRRDEVDAALTVAPSTLDAVHGGLTRARPMLRELGRLGRVAERTLVDAPRTFADVSRLLSEARPGLRAAPRSLRLARDATAPTLRLLERLDPVIPAIRDGLEAAEPLLTELGLRDCDVRRWFAGWRGALLNGVDSGHRIGPATSLRLTLLQTPETVGGQASPQAGVRTDAYPAPCTGGPR